MDIADIVIRRLIEGGYVVSNDFVVKKGKKVRAGVPQHLVPYTVANSATAGYKFKNRSIKKDVVNSLAMIYNHKKTPEQNKKSFDKVMVGLAEKNIGVTYSYDN